MGSMGPIAERQVRIDKLRIYLQLDATRALTTEADILRVEPVHGSRPRLQGALLHDPIAVKFAIAL
jgi:hypothetical protein